LRAFPLECSQTDLAAVLCSLVLMILVAAAAAITPSATSYEGLLVAAFFLGLAGSSFAVGVAYMAGWTPPQRQGSTLGICGLGTIGQSAAVFLGPVAANIIGWQNAFYAGESLLFLWACIFGWLARDANVHKNPVSIRAVFRLLRSEKLAWALAAFATGRVRMSDFEWFPECGFVQWSNFLRCHRS
jgi:MFS transporter, NNP family, nitrate/nitrite transporter